MNIKIHKICQVVSVLGLYQNISNNKDETIYKWFDDRPIAYALYFYRSTELYIMTNFPIEEEVRRFCEENNIVCK